MQMMFGEKISKQVLREALDDLTFCEIAQILIECLEEKKAQRKHTNNPK